MAKIENGANAGSGAKTGGGGGGQFESFLSIVPAFIAALCKQVIAHAEADRHLGMRLYQEAIQNAFEGAHGELKKMYQGMEPELRVQLDQAVMISGIVPLVEGGTSLIESGRLASLAALLDLASIIEKIKQFIMCILDCLGIHLCILNCLFILIDNLFGIFLGPVSREQAEYLSKLEDTAFAKRLLLLRERRMREGCSCST
jgi:hypothetical protein